MKNVRDFRDLMRPLALAMVMAGLTSLSLVGCDSATGKTANAAAAPQGTPISAAVVLEKAIVETQEFSGRMEAIDHVDVRARVGGYITAVNFKPGHPVKKGQTLFVIDPRPYEAELNRAEAAAAGADAKSSLAKLELARAQKLISERAIPQRELDEKVAAAKELDAAARAARAQYQNAKLNMGFTQVISPIDGIVSKAEITIGNLIDPTVVLTSVVSNDKIYATFNGDEETYLRVVGSTKKSKSAVVRVGLANEVGFPHEGRLEFVDNQLDTRTGAARMRAIFNNEDGTLAPGIFARVQLETGNGKDAQTKAVLINDRAVGTDQGRKYVYVVGPNNKAEYRSVTLGQINSGYRVVKTGLKAGETIVVNGLQRVRPDAVLVPKVVAMDFDPAAADQKSAKEDASTEKNKVKG